MGKRKFTRRHGSKEVKCVPCKRTEYVDVQNQLKVKVELALRCCSTWVMAWHHIPAASQRKHPFGARAGAAHAGAGEAKRVPKLDGPSLVVTGCVCGVYYKPRTYWRTDIPIYGVIDIGDKHLWILKMSTQPHEINQLMFNAPLHLTWKRIRTRLTSPYICLSSKQLRFGMYVMWSSLRYQHFGESVFLEKVSLASSTKCITAPNACIRLRSSLCMARKMSVCKRCVCSLSASVEEQTLFRLKV